MMLTQFNLHAFNQGSLPLNSFAQIASTSQSSTDPEQDVYSIISDCKTFHIVTPLCAQYQHNNRQEQDAMIR